jgi:hypothetical protein
MVLHLISGVSDLGTGLPQIGLNESVFVPTRGPERLIEVDNFL